MAHWMVSSGPSEEPLTLSQVKAAFGITASEQDDYITALITQARQYVERVTARALLPQTIEEYFDGFPAGNSLDPDIIKLHIAPVTSVDRDTGIKYLAVGAEDGAFTDWGNPSPENYKIDYVSSKNGIGPARIQKKNTVNWPVADPSINSVKVTYQAGYSDVSWVPGPLKMAMYRLIYRWLNNADTGDDFAAIADLVNPYKVHK